ncbi:MAG: FlgD immunoglobulin-like domain containing protein [Armatimonadota bacterium]
MQSTKAAIFKWSKQIARVPAMMLLITLFAAAMCMPQSFPPDLIWYQPVLDARSVAYTRDASGEELIAVPSRYGTVSLYRRGDGVRVKVIAAHSDRVNTVAFSADGSLLATGSDDTTVKIWRVQDRGLSVTPVHTLQGHSSWVNAVAFSQNGQYLASASRDGTVRVWNVASGETVRSIADGNPVTSVAFSPDGQLLATGSEGTTLVKIWRLNDGSLVRTLSGHTLAVQSVAFSPDGQYLASGSADRTVRVWQVDSGDSLHTLSGHTLAVQSVAFSPDGQYVASGSADNTVHVWRVNDGSLVRTLSGHTLAVQSVAFSPDGQYLASASADQSVRVWNASSGALAQRFSMDEVLSVATSPDGALVASGGKDGVVHFWEQPSGAETPSSLSATDWMLSIAISPDGQRIAAGSKDRSVYLWQKSGTLWSGRVIGAHALQVNSVALSSDNRLLASGSEDGQIIIWDVAAGSQQRTLNAGSPVYQVALAPDVSYETLIAAACADGNIRIWNANTGDVRGTIPTSHGSVNTLAFSPYNRYLVAGFLDGYLLLRDLATGTTREISAHSGQVFSVVFSPDGGLVVSAGADNTLKCWSVQGGELTLVKILGGPLMPSASRSVSFTPDGIFVVAGGEDGVVLWRVREAQVNAAPSIPMIISPENGAIVPPQPVFQFRASDANNDQLKFALELVQGEVVKRYETALTESGRTFTYTLPEELASGEWTWKVRAIDAKGSVGDWSNTLTFTVNRAPAVAEVLEPEDNSIVSPTPTLRLRASDAEGDQVRFRIRLVQGESEQSVETGLTDSGRSLLFTLPTELASGVWQYQVRAIDAKGSEGEWSTVRTFTVNRVAQSVEILAPSDGSVVSPAPTFQLRASDAEGDQVKFALELVQGEEVKRYETALTDSGRTLTYTLPEELASGEWTWKVRAIDARGSAGDWSNTRTFTVNRAPAVAEVLEPEDNSIVSPTPTLRLRASDAEGDQVRFRIRLVQGESEQSVETGLTDSGRSLLFTLPTELASGVWQYQVRAIDAKGSEGEWSTVRTFTVNRVAQSVEILAPSDGSVVSPAPTFQLRASDAEGDQVKFALELVQGEEVKRYETALTDSGRTLTYTLPEELASGEWTWKVRAIDARGSAGDWSNTRTFTVASEVPVGLPATLNGWGTGLNLGNATKRDVGLADVKMYKWDATSKQYIEVSADDPILVGQGYWIRPGTQMRLAIAGAPVASPFSIPLKAGWNYISNPFLRAVPWNAESVQVRRGGEVRDLMQATQSGWIFGYAWGWQPNPQHPAGGEYFPVYTTAGLPGIQNSLAPWQGYWVYAHVDCELILNLSSRQVVVSGRSGNTSSSTWGIQLRLSNGEHNAWAIIGAQREGTGTAIALPPSPPVTVPAPTMVILRDGVPLAVDLRVHNRSVQPWEISVNVPAGQHERATLYWQGAYTVPRDVNLVLVDLQTGERKFLRTSSSHTFAVSRQGGEYRFRIETVPDGGILRISSVRVSGGRGTGGRYTISYAVNTVAQVEVNILTSAGKIARRVASDITRSAGIQQVSWDGRDGNGIALPAGVYLAEIKATGSDGQVVRSTVPLVLTR